MKNTAIALTFASLLLTGTAVLAANPLEPSAPSSDKTPGVTPNDARMPLPGYESYYAPYYGFGPYYAPFYAMTFPIGLELPTPTLPIRTGTLLERRQRTDAR